MDAENIIEDRVRRGLKKKVGAEVDRSLKSFGLLMNDEDEDEITEVNDGDMDFDDQETEVDKKDFSKITPDEATKLINAQDVADVFIDVGEEFMKKGEVVSYTIYDNPTKMQLGTEYHPFSYDDLQKKYGGGHFKVVARFKGKYIKTEVRYLAGPKKRHDVIEDMNAKAEKIDNSGNANLTEIVSKITEISEKNAMSLANAINESKSREAVLQEQARERELKIQTEAKEREEKIIKEMRERMERESQTQLLMLEKILTSNNNKPSLADSLAPFAPIFATVLPKILEKDDSKKEMLDIMMKLQENNLKTVEKMQEANNKMFESLQKSIEKIAEGGSKKNSAPEINPFEMMKMLKDAESEGYEKFRLIREMAKEEAEERASLRGERDDDEGGGKSDSAIDTVIKSLAPMVAGKMLGGGTPQLPPQPTVNRVVANPQVISKPEQNMNTQHRGSVRNENIKRHGATTIRTQGTQVSPTTARAETKTVTPNKEGSSTHSFRTVRQPSVLDAIASLPEPEVKVEPVKVVSVEEKSANVEAVSSIVFPIVMANFATDGASVNTTSDQCVDAIINSGLSLSDVVRDFDDTAISGIIETLPNEFHEMIKELHNDIVQKLKNRIGQTN